MQTSPSSLSSLINKLKTIEQTKEARTDNIVAWVTSADTPYLSLLKPCVGSATVYVKQEKLTMLSQVQSYCAEKKSTRVFSTCVDLLAKLLHWDKRAAPSLDSYAGSFFTIPPSVIFPKPIEVIFIPPLKQLVTVNYGLFLAKRFISKLTSKDWFEPTAFTGFEVIDITNYQKAFATLASCDLIAMDIETLREGAAIRCIAYTGIEFSTKLSYSYVLPMDELENLSIMRKFNWELKAPKVFQNGKYDIAYLTRYSAPVYNYLYDTANLFHCWYSELPKDLGFLNSFFIREATYWKDLANTSDLYLYYKYNALDTWGTLNCFLAMVKDAPSWVFNNYLLEFPLTFPCHLCEMTGIKRNLFVMEAAKKQELATITTKGNSLNTILDVPKGQTFNVMSPVQMKNLLTILGCKDLESADAKNLAKAKHRHPFIARIIDLILDIRKSRKVVSTYLTEGNEFAKDRILYSLNPHGTDSGRLASKEHPFWCGINIQNVPRGKKVKQTFQADEGFYLAECDLEQAESRDTAYISGDETLIDNVENSPDFHSANASCFFGVPFEEIFDTLTKTVINKDLRNLAKPVNHGANYNMGAGVLIDSMGLANISRAKGLLKLPAAWNDQQVAEHLLAAFHKTYPKIRSVFYAGVIQEVLTTNLLVNKAVHWDDKIAKEETYAQSLLTYPRWHRYCFGKPDKSKSDLNSYIAHPPQSLNAQTLNKAFLKIFNSIALHPTHSKNFKLLAQIHDSILFQYRIGHDYLCDMVKEQMEIPLTIKAYDDKVRTFMVPAGIKKGKPNHPALFWSDTE